MTEPTPLCRTLKNSNFIGCSMQNGYCLGCQKYYYENNAETWDKLCEKFDYTLPYQNQNQINEYSSESDEEIGMDLFGGGLFD
ncbi:hypothetical protein M0813_22900 [Anaeramoeba flamelloides]|uniref:DUF1289 domain-containing protein n=1 Tax=Anaeramoeba flamelloides TaxID=1746091 RepID=A0ABQ8YC29_9EUKA|nr:hypothetical protein M0813_22900 [Anaeramoeba flamelloides]